MVVSAESTGEDTLRSAGRHRKPVRKASLLREVLLARATRRGVAASLSFPMAAVHQQLLMAIGFTRGLPQADFGQQGRRAEGQLRGAASNSHCRPIAVVARGLQNRQKADAR